MWCYRWSALVIAWIIALVGWLVMFSLPDQFSVKAVVYVDTSSVLTPLLKGLTPETDSIDELQIMTRVLLSRNNLMSVIRETDMDLNINTIEEKEELLKRITRKINITGGSGKKGDVKNNIYEIKYQSNSVNGSYQMVSSLLNTMIEETLKSTRTDTVAAQKFLDSQISVYEERLSIAEKKLAHFKKENVGYMPDERGGYYMRLQSAKDSVENISSALRLENRRSSELLKQIKGESSVLSRDNYQSENEKQIKEYQSQIDSLLNTYTALHPKVYKLQLRIKNLKTNSDAGSAASDNNASKEFNPVYQELKVELNKAKIEIELLNIQLKEKKDYVIKLNASIDVIPEVEAKLANLNRGYEVIKERYLDLVARSESAQMAQSAGNSSSEITFRVIEPPIMPFKPSGPKRIFISITVLLVALVAGFAWCYFRTLLQPTFINSIQLSSATDFPVLGFVNLYLSPVHKKRRRLQLLSFILVIFLLLAVFGCVLFFRDSGAEFFSSVLIVQKVQAMFGLL